MTGTLCLLSPGRFPAGVKAIVLCGLDGDEIWVCCSDARPANMLQLQVAVEVAEAKTKGVSFDAPMMIALVRRFLTLGEAQDVLNAPHFIHPDILGMVGVLPDERALQGSWFEPQTGEA